MPQELLRSVVPAVRSPRRWFMLPLSVAAHGVVAVAVFVIPITAAADLPTPAPPSGLVRYVKIAPPPPPVAETPRPRGPVDPQPRAAPTVAPSNIEPERLVPPSGPPDIPVMGTLPGGTGMGVPGGIPIEDAPPLPPPPPEPPRQPVRVGVGVREPKKIVHVTPEYPRIAQQARVEGVVILEAVIDADGRIDRLRVLRSTPLLDDAAIAAVKQWRYTPTLLNGVPVPVLMTITVNFRLH